MTGQDIAPLTESLPRLAISDSMKTAAQSVAVSFDQYNKVCLALPDAQGVDAIKQNLKRQKDTKQAYHLALKFLNLATLKANPAYDVRTYSHLSGEQQHALRPLLEQYLDQQLNRVIASATAAFGEVYQASHHPVMRGPA